MESIYLFGNGIGELLPFFSSAKSAHIVILAGLVSFAVCALNVATERWHGAYSFDLDVTGIQKVHKRSVPRTGGIGLAAGVLAVPLAAGLAAPVTAPGDQGVLMTVLLWLAAAPAFLAGITEDLTKRVSVRTRFCAILASALLAAWMLGACLPRLDTPGVDALMSMAPVALAVTAFAVVGVTNAVNIVDGFHGAAGATVTIVLAGVAYLCWREGDMLVTRLALAGIGATLGFLLLNYPTGRLFMGDGGAYFLGFWAAEVAVLAVARNPGISAWQILAIYAYPVIEVLFSIYRRKILRDTLVGAPDRLHLHSLFYRRFARQRVRASRHAWKSNACVACFMTCWLGIAALAAVAAGDGAAAGAALVAVQVMAYLALYMRLVRGHWGHCRHPAVILGLRPQQRTRPAEPPGAAFPTT